MVLVLVLAVIIALLAGFPVAFTLGGVSLLVAGLGVAAGLFDPAYLAAMPSRLFGVMLNDTLVAVPLFVFMGVMLERSRLAEELLETLSEVMGSVRGGLAMAVTVVGMLLAASTGIVGATVVTMGLLSLPAMIRRGYDPAVASGTICASGTLGQIIPPSIILVLLGDVMASAYQQAQLQEGIFRPETVSVGDLFAGALLPGLMLVAMYLAWLAIVAALKPTAMPPHHQARQPGLAGRALKAMFPPLALILAVLGSIIGGLATPGEAAGVGALGATLLAAARRQLDRQCLVEVARRTARVSSMVFMIFAGASLFSLVFRGYGGDEIVRHLLENLPGGPVGAMLVVMLAMFILGFVLDFIEITLVVVPIVGPVLLMM
ncbi:MAG: TRAP transporter large permease subunit, partial [Gammaproteobacteria bacterium]